MPTKAEWRAWVRTLPPVDRVIVDRVGRHVAEWAATLEGPVLGYLGLGDEIPLPPLSCVIALPRLGDDGAMTIHLDDGRRERHGLGIDQPPAGLPALDPAGLVAVVVPGRVFDRNGVRLGRGGGHYDRLLPRLSPGTPVVGVTCLARLVDDLPREPHDRPMTHLATETGIGPVPVARHDPTPHPVLDS